MTLAEVYSSAVQFRSDLEPAEWARRHVRLYRSTDSQFYRPEYTPWLSEPMREMRDNRNREICFTGPVGLGKSTMMEALTANIIAEDPGPMLITGQTDDDIQDWAETGLWPTLKACDPLKSKLPTARGTWRKRELIMPRSPIHLTGANMSGLQSKSERWCLGDEAWLWKPGMIEEMRSRLHRRWNGRILLVGQAGFVQFGEDDEIVGDDFTLAHDQGEQREWSFACPQCGELQPYLIEQLSMPEEGAVAERALAAVYECRECATPFADSAESRRAFVNSSRFVKTRDAILPGHISFHMNALALWRSPWADTALGHLQSQAAFAQGRSLPLQQFSQKQLAEPWDDSQTIERPDLDLEGERKDFAGGEQIEGEAFRFMTVDVGRDHYWVGVRIWRADASSVAIHYSKVSTEDTVERLREKLQVKPNHTYIDSGYDAGRVYDICARFGWVAIKGDGVSSYRIKTKRGTVEKLISRPTRVQAPCGTGVHLVHFAVNPLKDILARLRSGEGVKWQAVTDIGEDWSAQLDSEEKEEFLNPTTNQASTRYVKKKKHNHSWDVEVYQVAAALIWRVFAE